jgi:hypothetical protein
MRKAVGMLAAILVAVCFVAAFVGTGEAVPVESAKLPLSLQKLMDNPVIQVKKHVCDSGMCLGCHKMKVCDSWKHNDSCTDHVMDGDDHCCKHWHWKKDCSCSADYCHL